MTKSYLRSMLSLFMCFLMCEKSISIGFSQGEYSALYKTFTLNLLAVSSTSENLCIAALSISNTTFLLHSSLSVRMLRKVLQMKLSNKVESTPPSIIWLEITLSQLIAAINDKEQICLLFSFLRIESCLVCIP